MINKAKHVFWLMADNGRFFVILLDVFPDFPINLGSIFVLKIIKIIYKLSALRKSK